MKVLKSRAEVSLNRKEFYMWRSACVSIPFLKVCLQILDNIFLIMNTLLILFLWWNPDWYIWDRTFKLLNKIAKMGRIKWKLHSDYKTGNQMCSTCNLHSSCLLVYSCSSFIHWLAKNKLWTFINQKRRHFVGRK